MNIHNMVIYMNGKFYQIQILLNILQEHIKYIQRLQYLCICSRKDDMLNKLKYYPKNIEINNPHKFLLMMAISK